MTACIVWFSVLACGGGECVLHLETLAPQEALTLASKLESAPGPWAMSIIVQKWEQCTDD